MHKLHNIVRKVALELWLRFPWLKQREEMHRNLGRMIKIATPQNDQLYSTKIAQPKHSTGIKFYYKEYYDLNKTKQKKFSFEELNYTLNKGMRVLKKLGVVSWVGRGTLLGPYRDGAFPELDKDVDVSVYTDKHVYDIIKHLPFEIMARATLFEGKYHQLVFLDTETEVIFDLWFYHESEGKLFHKDALGDFWLPKEILMKLQNFRIGENTYTVPEPEWYLAYWYGPNWRTPVHYSGDEWIEEYERDCTGFDRKKDFQHFESINYID